MTRPFAREKGVFDTDTFVKLAAGFCLGQIGGREEGEELLVVTLPCCDNAKVMSLLRRRDSGGGGGVAAWSISSVFWTRTIEELRDLIVDKKDDARETIQLTFFVREQSEPSKGNLDSESSSDRLSMTQYGEDSTPHAPILPTPSSPSSLEVHV